MKAADFEFMRDLLKQRSGLVVNPDKIYLLESRLTPIARRMGLEGLDQLVAQVRTAGDENLKNEVTEAMTTNESFFFRDKTPFDNLENHIFPALRNARQNKKLRIWCAAASSGQEPYSIAILLKEKWPLWSDWDIEIFGTDISAKILDKARKGVYSQFEVQRGLPINMMVKYFSQVGELWQISDEIRQMVRFQEMNLLRPFGNIGVFDIIFCRNVLIYFDQPDKATVLERMYGHMPSDGALFLGAAETVLGISQQLKPVKGVRGIYMPAAAAAGLAAAVNA